MSWSPRKMGDSRKEREAKVRRTFGPLYQLVKDLRQGEIDAIKGEPVLIAWGEYMSIAHTLTGFAGCFRRIAPEADLSIFDRIAARLHHGTPLTESDVDMLELALRQVEAIYRTTPLAKLKQAIMTEQIQIELDALGANRTTAN